MSTDATPILQPLEDWPDWVPAPPPTDLLFDDGEPLESARHRLAMNTLIRSAKYFLLSGLIALTYLSGCKLRYNQQHLF